MGWVSRLWDVGFLEGSVCPLVGKPGTEARTGSPVGRAGDQLVPRQDLACWSVGQIHRLQGCSFLVAGVCPLVRLVPRLEQVSWRVGPGPRGSRAEDCPLVGRARSWGLWLEGPGLGEVVSCLAPVHWCMWPGPGPFGGQGHVQRKLWAQRVLR